MAATDVSLLRLNPCVVCTGVGVGACGVHVSRYTCMHACENKRPTSVIPQELTLLGQGLRGSETGQFGLADWTSSCLLFAYTATPTQPFLSLKSAQEQT